MLLLWAEGITIAVLFQRHFGTEAFGRRKPHKLFVIMSAIGVNTKHLQLQCRVVMCRCISVVPSIHIPKVCWSNKPSIQIHVFLSCGNEGASKCGHNPRPNHTLPSCLEFYFGRILCMSQYPHTHSNTVAKINQISTLYLWLCIMESCSVYVWCPAHLVALPPSISCRLVSEFL